MLNGELASQDSPSRQMARKPFLSFLQGQSLTVSLLPFSQPLFLLFLVDKVMCFLHLTILCLTANPLFSGLIIIFPQGLCAFISTDFYV